MLSRLRSDSERIKSWSLQAKNEDGVTHTIYNPNVHIDRAEDRYVGATVKYFDIPLSSALNYLYYSLLIDGVDSRVSSLTYFQIYSLDEVIEMPISSDGSYINVLTNSMNSIIKISQYRLIFSFCQIAVARNHVIQFYL